MVCILTRTTRRVGSKSRKVELQKNRQSNMFALDE